MVSVCASARGCCRESKVYARRQSPAHPLPLLLPPPLPLANLSPYPHPSSAQGDSLPDLETKPLSHDLFTQMLDHYPIRE